MARAHGQQGLREGPSMGPASPGPCPLSAGAAAPSWGQGSTGQVARVASGFGGEQAFQAGQCRGQPARASADGCQLQRVH